MFRHSLSIALGGLFVMGVLAGWVSAEPVLAPKRTYVGLGQAIVVEVAAGVDRVALINPRTGEETAVQGFEASASDPGSGAITLDLAAIFPSLWDWEGEPRTLYAQAWREGEAAGSPLVLQPMLTPERIELIDPATLEPTTDAARGVPMSSRQRRQRLAERGLPVPAPVERTFSGYRAYPLHDLVMATTLGEIRFRLRPEHAPNTVWRVMELARGGFYTEIPFHRVVSDLGDGRRFVAQVGDPTGTGFGGAGEWFDLEASELAHRYGVLSVARWSSLDSGDAQLFVCLGREGTRSLDGRYAAFGEAIEGVGAIEAIASVEVDASGRPTEPPVLLVARLEPAAPFPGRAEPVVAPDWIDSGPRR